MRWFLSGESMRSTGSLACVDSFRPFFWVDDQLRVRGWPEATARALHRPARSAMGRHCWEILNGSPPGRVPRRCRQCPLSQSQTFGPPRTAAPEPLARASGCAVLQLAGHAREAIVWLPFSHIVAGSAAGARLEGLAIRGALAARLDSIENTLEGLRRVCAADDCELFLLDPAGEEVVLVDCEGTDRDAFLERTRMPLGTGYPGTVTLHRKALYTNRFQCDPLFLRQAVKQRGIHSFLGVPLLDGDRPLGYLGLGWRNASVPMAWALHVVEDARTLVTVALRDRQMPFRRGTLPGRSLAIRCFGTFELWRHGRMVAPAAFGRRKALELLKVLILQHGAPLHRDQLVEILWPGVAPRCGANRLHGVVNALRSTLESQRHSRRSAYVVCRDDQYLFRVDAPHSIDLHEFLERIAEARGAQRQGGGPQALRACERAIELYRGDLFADDTTNEFFDAQRVQLRHSYLDAVRTVTAEKIHRGHDDDALHILRTALALEPVALDMQELLITRLVHLARIAEARQQYESCRIALRRHLDMDPPVRLRALEKLLY
jgi:DNA-binding SARP family transcriptional activator